MNFGSLNNPSNLHFYCVSFKINDKQFYVSNSTHVFCKKTIRKDVVFMKYFNDSNETIMNLKNSKNILTKFQCTSLLNMSFDFFPILKKFIGTTS